jgi:small subunit ribosomal protein S4
MKRRHKTYSRPKKAFDKERIIEEEQIKKDFGLKNKTEIWKAESRIKQIREGAKKMISSPKEEQEAHFEKLRKMGFGVKNIPDVLSLDKKDYMNRRLQTVLVSKKLATTPKGARQLITHKKVLVDGSVIDSPSYIVPVDMEGKISLKISAKAAPVNGEEEGKNEAEN